MRVRVLMSAAMLVIAASVGEATLIHHYTFDNADIVGTAGAGDVVGSADATPTGTNGGTGITTGQPGVIGQSYRFAGGTGGALLADFESLLTVPAGNIPFGNAERTFALWFNQQGLTLQNKIFGYGSVNTDGNSSTGEAFDVGLEGGGVRIRNFNGNVTYGAGNNFLGADAGWNHLAVRVNAGATTFGDVDYFLNGVLLTPQDGADPDLADTLVVPDAGFGIGNTAILTSGNGRGFVGLLDDFRIYDSALSDAEILALAIPEPASLASLLCLGLAAISRRRSK